MASQQPPYQHIRSRILADYCDKEGVQVGAKLPTLREMERRYLVSLPTISKAVSALAAEGRVVKRQGSGIYVAALSESESGLRRTLKPRIGCVVQSLRPTLASRIFEGVEHVSRKRGCHLKVASSDFDIENEKRQIDLMRQQGVQGVVLYPTLNRPADKEYLAREFKDFPIVVVDLYQRNMNRPHLIFDNYSAGCEMTRHLQAIGHKKIAIMHFQDFMPHRSLDDRMAGHLRTMEDSGTTCESTVLELKWGLGDVEEHESLAHALDQFLMLAPQPTAIIALDDEYCHATIAYLEKRGLSVPGDVTVVGFDNVQDLTWTETFATTHPNFVRMGERAGEILLDRIEAHDMSPSEVVLPCPLAIPRSGRGIAPLRSSSYGGLQSASMVPNGRGTITESNSEDFK